MKKILVIDDEPIFSKMIRDGLDSSKYDVSEAPDGIAGLTKVEEIHPDLILLDIMMPNLDGMGFLKNLMKRMVKGKFLWLLLQIFQPLPKSAKAWLSVCEATLLNQTKVLRQLLEPLILVLEPKS
jgi:CheY-like chemotaxis protein